MRKIVLALLIAFVFLPITVFSGERTCDSEPPQSLGEVVNIHGIPVDLYDRLGTFVQKNVHNPIWKRKIFANGVKVGYTFQVFASRSALNDYLRLDQDRDPWWPKGVIGLIEIHRDNYISAAFQYQKRVGNKIIVENLLEKEKGPEKAKHYIFREDLLCSGL